MSATDDHPDKAPGDPRPWEDQGAVRRDCEPHRGNLLSLLGHLTELVGMLTLFLPPLCLVAAALVPLTYFLSRRDIAAMRAGRMDPAGVPEARIAQMRSLIGATVALWCLVGWGCVAWAARLDVPEHLVVAVYGTLAGWLLIGGVGTFAIRRVRRLTARGGDKSQ